VLDYADTPRGASDLGGWITITETRGSPVNTAEEQVTRITGVGRDQALAQVL
jgi:hypothetical protein